MQHGPGVAIQLSDYIKANIKGKNEREQKNCKVGFGGCVLHSFQVRIEESMHTLCKSKSRLTIEIPSSRDEMHYIVSNGMPDEIAKPYRIVREKCKKINKAISDKIFDLYITCVGCLGVACKWGFHYFGRMERNYGENWKKETLPRALQMQMLGPYFESDLLES